jgi:glycosyltransferase involved in cell wall biosynthesis
MSDDSAGPRERAKIQQLGKQLFGRSEISCEYVYTRPNLGQVLNTNQGLKKAAGKYIRILHSDDLLHPDTIDFEIQTLKKHKTLGLYHQHIAFRHKPIFSYKNTKQYFRDYAQITLQRLHSSTPTPSDIVFSREALGQIGYFNKQFQRACDWDFFYRLVKQAKLNNSKLIEVSPKYIWYREHLKNNTNLPHTLFDNFSEYEQIAKTIAADLKLFGFNKKTIDLFNKKALTYRYKRLLSELKVLPQNQKTKYKNIVWQIISSPNDLDILKTLNYSAKNSPAGKLIKLLPYFLAAKILARKEHA